MSMRRGKRSEIGKPAGANGAENRRLSTYEACKLLGLPATPAGRQKLYRRIKARLNSWRGKKPRFGPLVGVGRGCRYYLTRALLRQLFAEHLDRKDEVGREAIRRFAAIDDKLGEQEGAIERANLHSRQRDDLLADEIRKMRTELRELRRLVGKVNPPRHP
jgi:hypothetical protein